MSVFCECCVLSGTGLCDGDYPSRGVLPTMVRRHVWSINLVNEEAMARVGPQRHGGEGREHCVGIITRPSSTVSVIQLRGGWLFIASNYYTTSLQN
jgi:hypothetical protein